MKNTHAWLVKTLLVFSILISGCARHPQFNVINVDSSKLAYNKLIERSLSLQSFSTDTEFFLIVPKGKFRLKGEMDYSELNGWYVELNGPFGIKLVEIESIEDGFKIKLPHSGTILEINEDEPFDLPELDVKFPNLSFVTTLLLPVLPFDKRTDWLFAGGELGESGSLLLISNRDDANDSLVVSLDYNTLKVKNEELWHNGVRSYKRTFEYESDDDYFPKGIRIKMEDLELYIKYGYVKADFDISRTRVL
ncbi:MAG: hypothetical protein HQ568_03370 [Calditrichaeota bacterium]|nr:hypothetical protein [Calditrichota bacterium]